MLCRGRIWVMSDLGIGLGVLVIWRGHDDQDS
jgi:hypothetical protein